MTRIAIAALLALGLGAGAGAALAQPKPAAPAAGGALQITKGKFGDDNVAVDGVLVVSGPLARPTALKIDMCFPTTSISGRIDRIVGPLALRGAEMTGTLTSLVDRAPVQVALRRKRDESGTEVLEGTLAFAGTTLGVSADEFKLADYDPLEIVSRDPDKTDQPSPNEIVVAVRLGAVPQLLDLVRRGGGRIAPVGLIPGCTDLREGKQVLNVTTSPDRAPALLAVLKALSGVTGAEMARGPRLDRAVRLPLTSDSAILAALTRAAAGGLPGAVSAQAGRDPASGEAVVRLVRRTPLAATMGLVEVTTVRALIGPDYSGNAGKRIVYVTSIGSRFGAPDGGPAAMVEEASDAASTTDLVPETASLRVTDALGREPGAELARYSMEWTPAPPGPPPAAAPPTASIPSTAAPSPGAAAPAGPAPAAPVAPRSAAESEAAGTRRP